MSKFESSSGPDYDWFEKSGGADIEGRGDASARRIVLAASLVATIVAIASFMGIQPKLGTIVALVLSITFFIAIGSWGVVFSRR